MRPSSFAGVKNPRRGHLRRFEGLRLWAAWPIIAPLGGGPRLVMWQRLRCRRRRPASLKPAPLRGLLVEESRGPMVPFFVWGEGFPRRMRDALMRLLEPPIEAMTYELVDLEFARQGRGGVLRIYIDRKDPAGPQVTVDD